MITVNNFPKGDKSLWADHPKMAITGHHRAMECAVLQGGMESGGASMMLKIPVSDDPEHRIKDAKGVERQPVVIVEMPVKEWFSACHLINQFVQEDLEAK